ncbi:MAG: hypothetical protein CMB67_02540 [Euryarchaeota archaeon]|nr:hypothetical protein [Euryarchaeota archaeon]
MTRDIDVTWGQLEGLDFFWLLVMVIISVGPFISAARNRTSFALAMVLSLLLSHFFRYALRMLDFEIFQFYPVDLLSIIPSISGDPAHFHRMITSAWLHADFIHVLGNILVIALAGVPLEQRLGPKRWIAVYFLGFLGGNLAWILSHPESNVPAIGASGAAFGILGAYMACWPEDKIEFPLIFLIRAWPVWLIAFIRLGFEILQMYSIQSGTAGETNIAHMAHVGGFFLSYALARTIARGGPSPVGGPGESMSGSSLAENLRKHVTERMGDISEDPWTSAGKPLEGRPARILLKLRKEGDELETRRAWLEELSENAICPICDGELGTIDEGGICKIVCSSKHIKWP